MRVCVPLIGFTLGCEVVRPLRSDNTKRMFPGPSLLNDATGMGMENGNGEWEWNICTEHSSFLATHATKKLRGGALE